MSLRLPVYHCALSSAWASFIAWALGRLLFPGNEAVAHALRNGLLGGALALGLTLVESIGRQTFDQGQRQTSSRTPREKKFLPILRFVMIFGIGGLGGIAGGVLDCSVSEFLGPPTMGAFVAVSIYLIEIPGTGIAGTAGNTIWALAAGFLGGLAGGTIALIIATIWGKIRPDADWLWSPSAMGFVAIGMCIGLALGLVRVKQK